MEGAGGGGGQLGRCILGSVFYELLAGSNGGFVTGVRYISSYTGL